MNWLTVGLAAAGWAVVLILLITLPVRTARRERWCTTRLRNELEPYLLRRATDLDMLSQFPRTTTDQNPVQVVDTLCLQISTLTEHDRSDLGISDTLPIDVTHLTP